MTPRRRRSADERRDQLVAAAVEVVAEVGYLNASADAVARRAGVSKGLLWHYFADRDELMETAARRTLVDLRTAVAVDLDLSAPVPQVIRAAIRRAAGLRRTHGAALRAIQQIVANLRDADGTPRFRITDYDETHAEQARIFRRGQEDGDIRPGLDPLLLAGTYQGSVDTMLAYLDAHPDVDDDRVAAAVADILLDGMCTQPRPRRRPRR